MADEITIVVRAEDAFSSVLGNFGNIMTGIKSTIDLVGSAFNTFKDIALAGIDAVGQYERVGLALTSLTAAQMVQAGVATDVSAAWDVASIKAGELEEWIEQLAIHSPFTFQGIADSFRTIQVYTGFAAEDTKRLTQALVDFAAGSGLPQDKINLIALALGQISTNGKLAGQDMLQLTSAGVPVLDILADHFGVTKDKIVEMRTDGLLPAQEVIEAITVWMETNFPNAADRFSTSWAGIGSTLQDLKQKGLREFFQGLADDIQPALVFLTNFVQSALIPFLGEIGDNIGVKLEPLKKFFEEVNQIQAQSDDIPVLSALGVALMHLQGSSDAVKILQDIGQELLIFQGVINTGGTPLDALNKALDDLEIKWAGSPLGDIITKIQEFIDTGTTEGWGIAIRDLFTDITSGFDLQTTVQGILDRITTALGGSNLKPLGEEVAKVLSGAIMTVLGGLDIIINQVDWKPIGKAIANAISQMWSGIINDPQLWAESDEAVTNALKGIGTTIGDIFTNIWIVIVDTIAGKEQWTIIGKAIKDGFMSAFNFFLPLDTWADQHIVQPIRRFLGISSPSTVFFQIGKDIIQGLINGINSISSLVLNGFRTLIDKILKLPGFKQIAEVLGINTSSAGSSGGFNMPGDDSRFDTGSGTTGGKPGSGGNGTSTTGTGGVVNYNFYGPVYMSGVPAEGSYDCPPNPIIQSGSNQVIPIGVH